MRVKGQVVEAKVNAGAAGAAGGGVVGTFVVWVMGWLLFGGSADASAVEATLAAVPAPVVGVVVPVVAAGVAWVAGFLAKHTPRPDLDVAG